MRPINQQLKTKLLEAARKEFLEKGFAGAQLRKIAQEAGATTGSIYKYYKDKQALFDALVSEPARELEARYRKVQEDFRALPLDRKLSSLPEVTEDESLWMMKFIYDHFDAFKLLICCSDGTSYAHFIETMVQIEVDASHDLIDLMDTAGMAHHPIDDELIHIVASALFSGIFETVRHDMPREKAYAHMFSLREFYSAGWYKILGIT
ncbi:TetR/AcrR family transcriptional regulator [bacterium 210820-DFI.6.37]|nr:TetR/AcrR family transcriptional regulator [bacterium 210820-DFI.6.37]